MIVGAGKKLKIIRTVLSNNVNDIYICQNVDDGLGKDYYTLIRITNDKVIKDVLKTIYDQDGNCKLPSGLFCGLFVDVDTLNILMKYDQPRKILLYLKSYMVDEYSQHMIVKNLLYQCLLLDAQPCILDLFLQPDNINLSENLEVWFNGFLDFSKFDKRINEEKCVKNCCELINQILLEDEKLMNESQVKAVNLFIKKKRNNVYRRMIELYNDFKITEKKYRKKQEGFFETVKSKFGDIFESINLEKILVWTGTGVIVLAVTVLICNIFNMDLPFVKYKGLNNIGTVNMSGR